MWRHSGHGDVGNGRRGDMVLWEGGNGCRCTVHVMQVGRQMALAAPCVTNTRASWRVFTDLYQQLSITEHHRRSSLMEAPLLFSDR